MSTTGAAPAGNDTLDFGRALRVVPEDPEWVKKILIGGLFTLLAALLIGAVFVGGYVVALIRRTARGEPRPLPDWDDLGGLFGEGLRLAGIYLAYLAVLMGIPLALGCIVGILAGGLGSISRSHEAEGAVAGLLGVGLMGFYALVGVAGLVLYVYFPAALTRFALLGRMSAGFEVRENLAFIQRNLMNYVLALVLYLVASFVAQFTAVLCCLPFFPASFWATCLLGWGLGETARLDPLLAGGGA